MTEISDYQPVGNFLLLQPENVQEYSKGGIYIPEQARHTLNEGIVEAWGPDVNMNLCLGDRVVFNQHSEYKVKIAGKEKLVVDAANVLLRRPRKAP